MDANYRLKICAFSYSASYTNIQLKGLNQGGYCGKIVPVMQGEEIHIHRRRKRGTSEVQKAKPG